MPPTRSPAEVDAELEMREADIRRQQAAAAPKSALAENPEVQALVTKAVAEAMAPLIAKLGAMQGGIPAGHDMAFLEGLALKISELADQGKPNAKRSVAPSILAARQKAHEAMVDAILRARAEHNIPEYEMVTFAYLGEQLIEPTWEGSDRKRRPTKIGWPGVPNEAMRPVNAAAQEIMRHFRGSIGHAEGTRDPLATEDLALRVFNHHGDVPETGDGRGAEGLEIRGRAGINASPEPVHILGTVAPPAQANQW